MPIPMPMSNPPTRRQVLRQFAAAAAAACATPLVIAACHADEQLLPIVDTHQHLWDLKKFRLPWIEKKSGLDRSYLMSDYLAEARGLNVVKTIYMEVDVDPAQQNEEADHVIGLCKERGNPMVAAVISGRPASDNFEKYV